MRAVLLAIVLLSLVGCAAVEVDGIFYDRLLIGLTRGDWEAR
jgi:hypothetical protein